MSRITCVWADLGEDEAANEWWEDTHIPQSITQIATTARNAQHTEENMFHPVPGIDGKYMTIYDVPSGRTPKEIDAQIAPPLEKLPKDARIDARCYREFAGPWYGEDWRDDQRDVVMWTVVLWQPAAEVHDELMAWFQTEFTAGMLENPDVLRTRIFKLEHASLVQDGRREEVNKDSMKQYMTLWEFACEDIPWDLLVFLSTSDRWRRYVEAGHLEWQIRQYLEYHEDDDIYSTGSVEEDDEIIERTDRMGLNSEPDEVG